jgi:hypothetical protein
MPADKSCFKNSSDFVAFDQSRYLGTSAISIDMSSFSVSPIHASPDGICFGYCCVWMKNVKRNKNYKAKDIEKETALASGKQNWMSSAFAYSGVSNALLLEDIGNMVGESSDMIINNWTYVRDSLNYWAGAKKKANFLLLVLRKYKWAHAIAVKLDRSYTGGWLNWSYPCAMFDPNIGHGMYNGHDNLATDLHNVFWGYGVDTVEVYALQCATID